MTGPGEDGFDLELAVAALGSNATDVRILLKLLVDSLASTLGSRLVVERSGGLLRKSQEIKAIQVGFGEDVLRAEIDGPSVSCTIGSGEDPTTHSSGWRRKYM